MKDTDVNRRGGPRETAEGKSAGRMDGEEMEWIRGERERERWWSTGDVSEAMSILIEKHECKAVLLSGNEESIEHWSNVSS